MAKVLDQLLESHLSGETHVSPDKPAAKLVLSGEGETVLKVKVPPVRIENSLSPLYRGTDFSTLAGTFQTVWGGGQCYR